MHGTALTPSGSSQPPISIGAFSRRSTIGSTGRSRRVSLITASTYGSSPERSRAHAAGWRASRSSAHDSAVAVVSWPATSSVTSSSRSSASVIGEPSSSWRAPSSIESTSSRSATSGAARRRAISSAITASSSRITRAVLGDAAGCPSARRRRAARAARASWSSRASTSARPRRRSSPPPCSETPKIARMTISSVIRCMRRPRGDDLARRARRRSPPRRPPSSARRRPSSARRGTAAAAACAGSCARASSSSSTEFGPTIGRRIPFASPACSSFGSPVKICLTAAGSLNMTQVPSLCDPQREGVAVAVAAALHERAGPRDPAERLQGERDSAGRAGAWRDATAPAPTGAPIRASPPRSRRRR